jgi:hypothetical protein
VGQGLREGGVSPKGDVPEESAALGSFGIEGVQLFAGLEANGFAGGDADLGAGAGITADAGFTGANAEDTESAEFDAVTGGKSGFETFKDGIDGSLGLGSRQACPFYHVMDNILLDQCRRPLVGEN